MTDPIGREEEVETVDSLFSCLANGDRRRLLGVLSDRAPDSLTRRDLATYLVPDYHETPRERDVNDEVQQALVSLHHTHVPTLDAAGLIEQGSEGWTVTVTDHPAFRDAGIVEAISEEAYVESDTVDALFRALSDARRRTILDVLSHQFGPIQVETLARELGANEQAVNESEVPEEDVERILVTLRHNHLPHLSDAALIEYDAAEGTVAYDGHPVLRVPWMHSVLHPDFRTSLTEESEARKIGTIEGREKVVSFGQSLCDRADEELFAMFTDTRLLEAGCLTRIRDAARRGVTVYLGTCDPTIKEYVEENAPGVIVWEPERNWLNVPVAGNRVGRLLLADREAVMLGTLKEEQKDGFNTEQAIIGEGTDNTLVVMTTQMLSPYLEQIDEGTEDVEATMPF